MAELTEGSDAISRDKAGQNPRCSRRRAGISRLLQNRKVAGSGSTETLLSPERCWIHSQNLPFGGHRRPLHQLDEPWRQSRLELNVEAQDRGNRHHSGLSLNRLAIAVGDRKTLGSLAYVRDRCIEANVGPELVGQNLGYFASSLVKQPVFRVSLGGATAMVQARCSIEAS